jgi:two-component system, NarL family, nitrate/nitrite response regulator NarL
MVCSACLLASARTVRPGDQLDELTPRETIVELVAEGFSNKEIGSRLGLNEKTLKHYMTNVLQKMSCKKCLAKNVLQKFQVRNRVGAAIKWGKITP